MAGIATGALRRRGDRLRATVGRGVNTASRAREKGLDAPLPDPTDAVATAQRCSGYRVSRRPCRRCNPQDELAGHTHNTAIIADGVRRFSICTNRPKTDALGTDDRPGA